MPNAGSRRSATRPVRRRSVIGVVLAATLLIGGSRAAQGFALWALAPDDGIRVSDIEALPNNFSRFEFNEITWKMDDDFRSVFDSALLRDQVRLAIQEWSTASNSLARRESPRYHWVRNTDGNLRQVFDLRSVVLHEIGHTLGAQHPDAAWFNSGYNRNFARTIGGIVATPPQGGEIMNEGNDSGSLPGAKPPAGQNPGLVARILSKDELQFLDYAYDGAKLTFVEVGASDTAQITISVKNIAGASSDSLGVGGPDASTRRVPGDNSQGRWITRSSASIDAAAPIGIDPSSKGWDVTNLSGESIDRLSIYTEGTDNKTPLAASSSGSHRFTTRDTDARALPLYQFESLVHRFGDPAGGSVGSGDTVPVGLQQDVWDWTASKATARTLGGAELPISLLSLVPWDLDGPGLAPGGAGEPDGLTIRRDDGRLIARGLRLTNSDAPVEIRSVLVANIDGLDIDLDDFTRETIARLTRLGLVTRLDFAPLRLGANEEFILVFEGDIDDLPRASLAEGRFRVFDLAGLLDHKLLAFADTVGEFAAVGAFALINEDPILGRRVASDVPAPGGLLLVAPALLLLVRRRRAPA